MQDAELPEGAHVSEQWVASSLNVSRTPARNALNFLVDVNVVEKIPRRGFFLRKSLTDVQHFPRDFGDESERLYARIIEDYLQGRFVDDFTAADLQSSYGLTVRQANQVAARMEAEDLIRRKAGRGWEFLRTLTTREAHDQSYRFRLIIEPAALMEPEFRINRAEFDRHRMQQLSIVENVVDLTRPELFRYNTSFHEMLSECSGNSYLADAVKRANRMRRMIEYHHQADLSRLISQAQEHLHLLELIDSGRQRDAAKFMYTHLDTVRELKTGIPRAVHGNTGSCRCT